MAILQAKEAPPEASMCLVYPELAASTRDCLGNGDGPAVLLHLSTRVFGSERNLEGRLGFSEAEGSLALTGPLTRP